MPPGCDPADIPGFHADDQPERTSDMTYAINHDADAGLWIVSYDGRRLGAYDSRRDAEEHVHLALENDAETAETYAEQISALNALRDTLLGSDVITTLQRARLDERIAALRGLQMLEEGNIARWEEDEGVEDVDAMTHALDAIDADADLSRRDCLREEAE